MNTQISVAVWVKSFQKAENPVMMREGSLMRLLDTSATICAASSDRAFRMEIKSGPLAIELLAQLQRFYAHGFTVVEVPDYWVNESSRPRFWRDALTKQALERVHNLREPSDPAQAAPYDEALAHEVLTTLNLNYPHMVNIVDVKRALAIEPSDNDLLTALEALSHEEKIERTILLSGRRSLQTTLEIRITSKGRDALKGANQTLPNIVIQGDQINTHGPVGAVGRNSVGTINYQHQWAGMSNQVSLSQVAIELESLRSELMKTAKVPADFQQFGLIAEAEQHAKKQDGTRVMEVLSKAGKGLLDFAKDVGSDVTAKLISKAMGLEP